MRSEVAEFLAERLRARGRDRRDYMHWHLQRDKDDVLWLSLDCKDRSGNTLDADVLKEFEYILNGLADAPPKALVLRSLKASGFCAGADIKKLSEYGAQDVKELLQHGHNILDTLEKLSIPTVAVVHGHCLGGGFELALACDRRIGIRGGLEMGFPEVRLGLHPGLGGSFRLIDLIGPVMAMTMMLTGKSAHDRQALSRGLVDSLVEERHLNGAVSAAINGKLSRQRPGLLTRLQNLPPLRMILAGRLRRETEKKAPARHYPAPQQLISLWQEHGSDRQAMQQAEIESFSRLLQTQTSRNLVRVFFLRDDLKQAARGDHGIHHVHVIGAGAMGGDIAAWCAVQGCRVTLSDISSEPIAAALSTVDGLCRQQHQSSMETRNSLDRFIPDPLGQGIARADLIIEAVPEDAELKKTIYQDIESRMPDNAILASNTSSIPLETLASFLVRPERLVGIHFFNPVSRMLIVEVVAHNKLDKAKRERALAFTGAIAKLPVAVQSYPGFLVNRALTPYLMEAVMLLDEGMDLERIDKVAVEFGMPMGPLELADQVGLDICLHVADVLRDLLEKPLPETPDWLRAKVENGELGRKTGQGFYRWQQGRASKASGAPASSARVGNYIGNRLILPLLDACVEAHRQGVVQDLNQLDAAMIFATGFAPFRGGPMHYARSRGIDNIVAELEALAKSHGERFNPDPGWQALLD